MLVEWAVAARSVATTLQYAPDNDTVYSFSTVDVGQWPLTTLLVLSCRFLGSRSLVCLQDLIAADRAYVATHTGHGRTSKPLLDYAVSSTYMSVRPLAADSARMAHCFIIYDTKASFGESALKNT